MAVSRSAAEFLRRAGIVRETLRPAPRLCPDDLLVHVVPLKSPPDPAVEVLVDLEGDPPPDNAGTREWPRTEEDFFTHGE